MNLGPEEEREHANYISVMFNAMWFRTWVDNLLKLGTHLKFCRVVLDALIQLLSIHKVAFPSGQSNRKTSIYLRAK